MRPTLPILLTLSGIVVSAVTAQAIFPGADSWAYQGCYTETTTDNSTNNARALAGGTETTENMTVGACLQYCKANSYTWAGVEYTKECYCGPSLNSLSRKVADAECNLACVGNETQFCGGSLRLSVYQQQVGKGAAAGRLGFGADEGIRALCGMVAGFVVVNMGLW